ncbi:centrosomal protein of 72 kDa-like isoform X1 [Hemitrygon akajei]|uniref:centrosomal protein of 72 kDa-like isoform X1 n=1 Tax=Hemitrygon akajei TaxID=2704970 RepID=UPI003BFA0B27
MTAEQVVATEEWLRDKAQLSNVRSDEVETLSLHGSYHEKIVTLGDSLLNFKRLKSLDLSRNAIVSLEGLECLQELEKLSLYFNNIQTLEEISSLRHLIHLTELDLRLNPVTSTVENYRQYVIRLLPNLLNLDLRPVHATERNATKLDFVSQEQYETSEVDKREESQQMKTVFSYDTDQQNYVNQAQMYKWGGASYNQSDVKTTTKYRSCRSIDEDDSTSIHRSGMLSTSQISHNGTSTVHRLVDRQQLLSPSNSLISLRTTCLKRSFTDRKLHLGLQLLHRVLPSSEVF